MSARVFALLGALLLCGCSDGDWDHAMSFAGLDDTAPPAEAAAAPAEVVPARPRPVAAQQVPGAPDPFCASVASHDASGGAFDAETQRHVYAQSYGQCLAIFGPGR